MDYDREDSSMEEDSASEKFSLNSDDEDESESDEEIDRGVDIFGAKEMDIPSINDIPVVSKLAKEEA